MSWILIRHGQTQGNLLHRYIGRRTDEPLCPQGIHALREKTCPDAIRLLSSPMRRCTETAALLYPNLTPEIILDFCECDFGDFENKSYDDLNGRADYQAWIDSGGELPFPDGESRSAFAARCVKAFAALEHDHTSGDCALIVHGGTIMAIMEAFARPTGSYFDFQVKNGEGFILHPDGSYRPL